MSVAECELNTKVFADSFPVRAPFYRKSVMPREKISSDFGELVSYLVDEAKQKVGLHRLNGISRVGDISVDLALPQFVSAESVVGCEIEGAPNGCEVMGITAATSAVDVLDHHRA